MLFFSRLNTNVPRMLAVVLMSSLVSSALYRKPQYIDPNKIAWDIRNILAKRASADKLWNVLSLIFDEKNQEYSQRNKLLSLHWLRICIARFPLPEVQMIWNYFDILWYYILATSLSSHRDLFSYSALLWYFDWYPKSLGGYVYTGISYVTLRDDFSRS